MRNLIIKVTGVTYEGRQAIIARLTGYEPCRLTPEPDNPYDANAIRVEVATKSSIKHVGYVPRELAAEVAPYLDGESLMVKIDSITGGFDLPDGDIAAYGLRLRVELPDREVQ